MSANRVRPKPEPEVRAVAEEILGRVERAGAYASVLLESHAPRLRDPRDVALLHEWVYGVLRNRSALDRGLETAAGRPLSQIDEDLRPLLRIAVYSIWMLDRVPDHAAVNRAVARTPYKPGRDRKGFVNAVLRKAVSAGRSLLPAEPLPGDLEGLSLFRSHPLWWVERAVARWGWEHTDRLAAAHNEPPPPIAHVDPRLRRVRDVLDRCAELGIAARPGRFAPQAVRLESGIGLRGLLTAEPTCWAQDEASQLVPLLLGDPGDRIADLCAAPGGKALQIACAQAPDQQLFACDRNARRLQRLRKRLDRADLARVRTLQLDSGDEQALAALPECNGILVDAPCSGTGTLRRHPEIRWRLLPEDLPRLAKTQSRILEAAATRVAPGGALVYSVCSTEVEEGPERIAEFLDRHPGFRIESPAPFLPEAARVLVRDGALQSSPLDDGLDGFFAVRLIRTVGAGGV